MRPLFLLLPIVTMLAIDRAAPGAGAVPAPLARALQATIDAWAAGPSHVGVSASVVMASGAQWIGAAGAAGPEGPMRPDHLIQIASITKTMTAAIVLQLVDEGILRLEDPIDRWLPGRRFVDRSITIRQLLNHTSGVANYTGVPALGAAIDADPARVFSVDELLAFVGEPRFAPGSSTEYTNTSFLLLGQIAERASGRSILDLYEQRLFQPLGLTAIFMPGLQEPPGPVAYAWATSRLTNPLAQRSLLSIGHSAFGLLSNAATVARWGDALFRGQVLSDTSQKAMRTLVAAAGNIPGETGAGLGIRSYQYLDRTQYGHSGGATFGNSLLLFDPDSSITVAVVMNQGQGAEHFTLAPTLLALASAP